MGYSNIANNIADMAFENIQQQKRSSPFRKENHLVRQQDNKTDYIHRAISLFDEFCSMLCGYFNQPIAQKIWRRLGHRSLRHCKPCSVFGGDGGDGAKPRHATNSRIQLWSRKHRASKTCA